MAMWPALFRRLQERRTAQALSDRRSGEGERGGDPVPPALQSETVAAGQPSNAHQHIFANRASVPRQDNSTPRDHLSRSEGRRRFATRVEDCRVEDNSSDSLARAPVATSSASAEAQSVSTNPPVGSGSFSPSDSPIVGDGTNKKPPAAVKSAIADFPVISGLTLRPPTDKETSYIYKWGVRVEMIEDGKPVHHWICLADDTCRKQGTNFTLSSGRTSKAASHLASVHGVVSRRMQAYKTEKRKRQDEIEHLRTSPLFISNPRRFNLLIEVRRIINNCLSFRFGEYKESRIIEALLKKEDARVVIYAAKVSKVIVELYVSTKNELMSVLADSKMASFGNLVIMADFWTCTVAHKKYLGVRVYFVDANWEFRSLLLGVRQFLPSYGDREGGIQGPYKAWVLQLLGDFGLSTSDFFGSTSDAGPDVKNLMTNKLQLKWEWCMAHMAHAATKEAFGMNGDTERSRNPGMTKLIADIKKTISDTQSIEKTGDLFPALCTTQTSTSTIQLLSYTANRFLSVESAIRRILDKWNALVSWYDERARRHTGRKAPPQFLLRNRRLDLEQILSLLGPITSLKRLCQAEKPNQVEVLMELYQIRLDTLNLDEPLEDYRSKRETPRWIEVGSLTELAGLTRRLLRDAFDTRFFCRYTTDDYLDDGDFVFEMQQRLHPEYKNPEKSLNTIIRRLYQEKRSSDDAIQIYINRVNETINTRLRGLLEQVSDHGEDTQPYEVSPAADEDERPFSRIRERFGTRTRRHLPLIRPDRAGQELRRWEVDPVMMGANENVLDFWKRMEHSGAYSILPKAAKVLFALPSSSAQIERDFSVCGDMVTSHRASLSASKLDMCAFLNRNEEFVDIAQCESIPDAEIEDHIPQCVSYDLEATPRDAEDEMIIELFSQTSVDEEEEEAS